MAMLMLMSLLMAILSILMLILIGMMDESILKISDAYLRKMFILMLMLSMLIGHSDGYDGCVDPENFRFIPQLIAKIG